MATAIEIILLVVIINVVIISWMCFSCFSWTKICELSRSLIKKMTNCCIKMKETQSNPFELTSTRQNGIQELSSVYNSGSLPSHYNEWNIEADRRRQLRIEQSMSSETSHTGLVVQLPPERTTIKQIN